MKRDRNIHVMLSELELERLRELADRAGTTQANYIRQLLRNEWQTLETEWAAGARSVAGK